MSAIQDALNQVEIGKPVTFENLTMFPILGNLGEELDYLTLDEALDTSAAAVTEVSDSGIVPELLFSNEQDISVLLIDGDELVGAKQNRILNLSILAPGKQKIRIPVSCVEAGRWVRQTSKFTSSRDTMYSRGRAAKSGDVTNSLKSGTRRSDQHEIWRNISDKAQRMKVHSRTEAMSDMYESYAQDLERYLPNFNALNGQIGAMFSIDGMISGLDIFDKNSTLKKVLPKLVRSYALDAVETSSQKRNSAIEGDVENFFGMIRAATIERFPAVGLGEDLRLKSRSLSGGALVVDSVLVHFCVFPNHVGQDRSFF